MRKTLPGYTTGIFVLLLVALAAGAFPVNSHGQETAAVSSPGLETLAPVEVEPPADDQRRVESRTGQLTDGFGYDQPIPSGMPFSDYSLTPGEVVSATRTPANLASVHSSISVVENKGIGSVGRTALPDMLEGLSGVWTSSFSGTPFDSQIVLRGFSNESVNRVALLVDGRPLNIPRQEANTNFFFPEIIDRVEVMRGDGNVQFGNKAIGGAVNVILKKPRQNPGTFFGAEAGSWQTHREWAGVNVVKGPLAAGVFLGRFYQGGWRIWEGNGIDENPVYRPGPWCLNNFTGSVNWKITPRLTLDIMLTCSDSRGPNPNISLSIGQDRWERRDTRNVENYASSWGSDYYYVTGSGPEEKWDNASIGKLFYDGDRLGRLEINGSWRSYDRRHLRDSGAWPGYTWNNNTALWQDYGLCCKYSRSDKYNFIRNDLTLGADLFDGRFRQEVTSAGVHTAFQGGYRESISYYLVDTLQLWDRLVVGLGYRIENYDMKNLYSNGANRQATFASAHLGREKSASQYSLGFVYDKELGSNIYYKHARLYRFPNFDDMVNLMGGTNPFWELDPEEGTLQEAAIRHWITKNIYAECTYYELDMDTEILFGEDLNHNAMNLNVYDVSHSGVELSAMIRFTPRWTFKGNLTHQKVLVRSNFYPDLAPWTTEDKWLWQNPTDMANASLAYSNKEWGFSGIIKYHYVGSRYRINDPFNRAKPLEPAKWGDLAFSQDFFGGMATLYFGIKNFTDSTYAIMGTKDAPYYNAWGFPPGPVLPDDPYYYPNAGRTYYGGVKSSLDFNRMRMPTTDDLVRMNRSLYGFVDRGRSAFTGMGSWMRNLVPF